MTSKAIIGGVVLVIIIGGGAWYVFSKGGSGAPVSLGGVEDTKNGVMEGVGTFKDIFTRGGSWKCEVKTAYEGVPSEGTFYVSGEEFRGDFSSNFEGQGMVTSHLINAADGYTYSWTDAYPQGMKMKISEKTDVPSEGDVSETEEPEGGIDYNQDVQYSCGPWAVDASKFSPPAEVTFMELGENGLPVMPMPQ